MLPFGWVGRLLAHAALGTVLAGAVALPAAPASTPVVSCLAPGPARNPGGLDALFWSISATSGCNAWAVGEDGLGPGRELVEHWDGTRWTIQHTPVIKGRLDGVSALSPDDAWAVGESGGDAVFEHWDGKAWRRVHSPLWSQVTMNALTAISPSDVWAVGEVSVPGPGAPSRTLLVHWDGRTWRRFASPNPANVQNVLNGVSATSAVDVWVVGCGAGTGNDSTFITHWDGRRWQRLPNPAPPAKQQLDCLDSVSATSADDVWALADLVSYKRAQGDLQEQDQVVMEHWDGRRWWLAPNHGLRRPADSSLDDVVAVTPTLAWAVGCVMDRRGGDKTLAERWNGKAWRVVKSPSPDGPVGDDEFNAVTVASSGAAWAAGFHSPSPISLRGRPFVTQLP
jgi:hypothetical protein